jgi:hypothetical protein
LGRSLQGSSSKPGPHGSELFDVEGIDVRSPAAPLKPEIAIHRIAAAVAFLRRSRQPVIRLERFQDIRSRSAVNTAKVPIRGSRRDASRRPPELSGLSRG